MPDIFLVLGLMAKNKTGKKKKKIPALGLCSLYFSRGRHRINFILKM